jgi:hypothetical protein
VAQPDGVTFQAPRNTRIGAVIGIVVLALIVARVVYSAGWYATIGVLLVLGIIFNLWWIILRPKLVVGREGIEVVSGWQPATVAWKDVQRCEVSPKGTLLVLRGGQEVVSKFPAGGRAKDSDPPSEADRAAAYLAACVAWGKRGGSEPMPVYDH